MRCKADTPRHPAHELIQAGLLVEKYANIVDANDAANFNHFGVRIDGDLSKDSAPGLRAHRIPRLTRLRLYLRFNRLVLIPGGEINEAIRLAGLRLRHEAARFHITVRSLHTVQWRCRVVNCEVY